MPYNAQGQWYYDPNARKNIQVQQYQDENLNKLSSIATQNNVSIPTQEPKMGIFQRLINLLRIGETAPVVQAIQQKQNPITAYLSHIGKTISSTITGKPYEAPSYNTLLEKKYGTPNTPLERIFQKGVGLAGDIFADPTTYLTAGVSKGIKFGSQALEATAKSAIKKTAEEIALKQGIKEITPEIMSQTRKVWQEGLDKGSPEYTKYVDRGGLKFGGATIIPGKTIARPFKKPLEFLGNKSIAETFKKNPIIESIGKTFSRDYGLSDVQKVIKQTNIDEKTFKTATDINNWLKIIKPVKNEADRVKLSKALEKNNYFELTPTLRTKAKEIRTFLDNYIERGKQSGILDKSLKGYVPHVYKNPEADLILSRIPERTSSVFKYGKQRTVESLEKAQELMLNPEWDIAKSVGTYIQSFNKAESNTKYLQDLFTKLGVKGTKDITEKITKKITQLIPDIDAKTAQHVSEIYKNTQKGAEISMNLEGAQAGGRIFSGYGADQTVKGYKSSFPEWLPEGARTKKITDKIIEHLNNGTFPAKNAGNIRDGYKATVEQLLSEEVPQELKLFSKLGLKMPTKITKIDQVLEQAKQVPLTSEEIAKIEAGMTEKLVPFSDPAVGKILLPQSVVADLTKNPRLINDESVQILLKGYDKALNFWKGSVTSLFPAFHVRNAMSNVAQNFLDIGIDAINPITHSEAINIMRKGGKGTLKTDLGEVIPYELLRLEAGKKQILAGNSFITDIGKTIDDQLLSGLKGKTRKFITGEYFFKAGRSVGGAIEDEARMVNFISNVKKGMSFEEAAQHTKKFLFDYSNLSSFEKTVMKRLIPFYTWVRKNISLQLEMLAKQPGKLAMETKTFRNIGEPVSEDEKLNQLPSWAAETAGFKKGTDKYGRPLFFTGTGLPIEAATKFSVKDLLSMLSPAIKSPMELASGKDWFRGKDIKDVYKANEVAEFVNIASKAFGIDEKKAQEILGIKSYKQNVYVKNKKTGEKETVYTMDPTLLYILRQLPSSRLMSTLGYANSPDVSENQKLLKLLTGVKAYSFDQEEQQYFKEQDIKDKLQSLLQRQGKIGVGEYFYKKK